MSEISERLLRLIAKNNLSYGELSKITGIPKSAIQRYATGETEKIPLSRIELLAKALHTDAAYILGWNDYESEIQGAPTITNEFINYPVIAEVAAGFDKIAFEDWSGDKIEIPLSYLNGRDPDDFFVLRVIGDSMYPLYIEGDKVLVLRQTATDYNGQIAIVIYDDELGTIKKVEQKKNAVDLVPINPHYPPEHITGDDIDKIHILGIPKLLVRELDEE